jgi:hypothetical protein
VKWTLAHEDVPVARLVQVDDGPPTRTFTLTVDGDVAYLRC